MHSFSLLFSLSPLYSLPSASLGGSTPTPPPPPSSSSGSSRGSFHPNLLSETEIDILQSRAGLVIRMIQLKIGQDLLLQVFNKLLTLASAAASQTAEWSPWQNLIISTGGVSAVEWRVCVCVCVCVCVYTGLTKVQVYEAGSTGISHPWGWLPPPPLEFLKCTCT